MFDSHSRSQVQPGFVIIPLPVPSVIPIPYRCHSRYYYSLIAPVAVFHGHRETNNQ